VATTLPGYTSVSNILVNANLNRVYLMTSTGLRVLNGNDNTEIANIAVSGSFVINKTSGRFLFGTVKTRL
jgi:hypothetical protein